MTTRPTDENQAVQQWLDNQTTREENDNTKDDNQNPLDFDFDAN